MAQETSDRVDWLGGVELSRCFLTNHLKGIIMKKVLLIGSLSILLAGVAYTYDIHHPNLKDAHMAVEQAIHHIELAQKANKGVEFGGHAEKAIDHLKQAQAEIVEADKWNDAHGKK